MNRWENLSLSQQHQHELQQATTSSATFHAATHSTPELAHHGPDTNYNFYLGELIRQEFIESSNLVMCHYRNISDSHIPISFLCELGCCSEGCCGIEEFSHQSAMGYGWAVILLCSFIFCVLLASVVMFVLYSNNRRRDINLRQRLAEFENTAPIGMRSEGDMSNTLGSLSSDVYSPSNGSQKSPPFHQVYHIYRPGSDTYRSPTFPSTYHQFSSQYWPKSVF